MKPDCTAGGKPSPNGQRWLTWAAFALVILAAVAIRLRYLDRQIWTAEAWVADSVALDRFREMFYDPTWLQTTPPVFLLLERAAVDLLGLSNWSLRLIPFAFGVLTVILTARLCCRVFEPPFALFCTMLVALSPPAAEYSKELKQYSADAAVTALVLLALWGYLTCPGRRSFWRVAALFGLTLGLSYTAVMLLPLAVTVLWLGDTEPDRSDRSTKFRRCLGLVSLVGILSAAEYILFVRPNVSPLLLNYWKDGFPPLRSLHGLLHFYAENFAGLLVYFFVDGTGKGLLLNVLNSASGTLQALMLFGCAGAIWSLIVCFRHSLRHRYVALFCGMPVLTLAALNLLHLYPVGSRRVMLFLLPCVAVGVTLVLESVWMTVAPAVGTRTRRWALASLSVSCLIVVLTGAAKSNLWRPYAEEDEDAQTAIRYLQSAAGPGDLIYVHASLVESAKLYVRMLGSPAAPIIYGNTGWPCCVRDLKTAEESWSNAELRRELRDLAATTRKRTLWLLFTGRTDHWQEIGRNDPEILVNGLHAYGCRVEGSAAFPKVVLRQVRCP